MGRKQTWSWILSACILGAAASVVIVPRVHADVPDKVAQQLGLYSPNEVAAPTVQPATTTPAADLCGAWSAEHAPTALAISAKYGQIRNCIKTGDNWVVTTLGSPDGSTTGAVGIYACAASDSACQDGRNDHPISGWKFFTPPYPGSVTILAQHPNGTLIVSDAGHQMCFDVDTASYTNSC
jgi:hypothetical protein